MLLTRAPLYRGLLPFSLDLHVLSAPLTFVLSQDQTLQLDLEVVPRGIQGAIPKSDSWNYLSSTWLREPLDVVGSTVSY